MGTLFAEEYGTAFLPALIITGSWFLVLGTLPLLRQWPRYRHVWFGVVFSSALIAITGFYTFEYTGWKDYYLAFQNLRRAGHTSILWEDPVIEITSELIARWDFITATLAGYCLGICAGVASDFLFIAVTRRALQWVSEIESFSRMISIVV